MNMEITTKLYEKDSYCREFDAVVLSCEKTDDGYNVVLDKTAFFPEGGGQKADTGKMGDGNVFDTQLQGNTVIHKVTTPQEVGTVIHCSLDWDIRFGRMQNHSAEHIVSGIASTKYACTNVGFHMGEKFMTVDFDKKLTKADIENIENLSNAAICNNLPITVMFPTGEEIPDIPYRSKKEIEGDLRLVKIGDVDCCACCAPHVKMTGEIGLVKIIDFSYNKGGTKVEIIAGFDALADYRMINDNNKDLMKLLCAPRDGILEFVKKQMDAVATLTREKQAIQRELAEATMELVKIGDNAFAFLANCTFDDLRYLSNNITTQDVELCVLLSETNEGEYNYVLNSKSGAVIEVLKGLNEAFNGKGGGKPDYAQGKLSGNRAEIEKVLRKILA